MISISSYINQPSKMCRGTIRGFTVKRIEKYYEIELTESLKNDIEMRCIMVLEDSTPYFQELNKIFPLTCSGIAWSKVRGVIQRYEDDNEKENDSFINFFDEMIQKFELSGDLIYLGDSLIDFVLTGTVTNMRKAFPIILETLPHHHYFVSSDFSWCMCFSMIGGMFFGFAPNYNSPRCFD